MVVLAYYFAFPFIVEYCSFKSIKGYRKSNFGVGTGETLLFFWDQNSGVISAPGIYETIHPVVCLYMRNHLLQNLKIPMEL